MSAEVEVATKAFDFTPWVPIFLIAMWGGIVAWFNDVRLGKVGAYDVFNLVGRIVTAGFSGTAIVLPFNSMIHDDSIRMALAAGAGVMGIESIVFVQFTCRWLYARFTGIPIDQLPQVASLAPVPKSKGGNSQTDSSHSDSMSDG